MKAELDDACKEIAELNIEYWEKEYKDQASELTANRKWNIVLRILEDAEILGDEDIIAKHKK